MVKGCKVGLGSCHGWFRQVGTTLLIEDGIMEVGRTSLKTCHHVDPHVNCGTSGTRQVVVTEKLSDTELKVGRPLTVIK